MLNQLQNALSILRLKQVQQQTGLSRSLIYAEIKAGRFPRQFKLTSSRSVGWLASEINDYIQSRINASRNVMNGGV